MSLVHLLATDRQRSVLDDSRRIARAYTAYGATRFQAGPMSAFCGEHRDPLTGCYHLGNGYRQFNPVIMRFHSPDALAPFGDGGLNAYMYCEADPVNLHDPTGAVAVWVAPLQRILTGTLHVVSPVALMIGPTPKGALAVNASRAALLGSATSAVGAGLGLAGVAAAPYVSAAGTTLLLAGAGTRLGKALWDNRSMLWSSVKKNARSNLRTIFKGRVEKKHKASPPNSPKKSASTLNTDAVFTIEGGATTRHTSINLGPVTNNHLTVNVNIRTSV